MTKSICRVFSLKRDRIICARCGGRLRYRKTSENGETDYRLPARCSHCGVKAQKGDRSIAVVLENAP